MELPRAAGKAEAHTQQGRVQGIQTSSPVGMHLRSTFYKTGRGGGGGGGDRTGLGGEALAT